MTEGINNIFLLKTYFCLLEEVLIQIDCWDCLQQAFWAMTWALYVFIYVGLCTKCGLAWVMQMKCVLNLWPPHVCLCVLATFPTISANEEGFRVQRESFWYTSFMDYILHSSQCLVYMKMYLKEWYLRFLVFQSLAVWFLSRI